MASARCHGPSVVQLHRALLSGCSRLCHALDCTAAHPIPAVLNCRRRHVLVRLGTRRLQTAGVTQQLHLKPQLQLSALPAPCCLCNNNSPVGFSAATAAEGSCYAVTPHGSHHVAAQVHPCKVQLMQPLLRRRWTAVLTQRSKLPVLAPFLSLVACYCNLLGQVRQDFTTVAATSDPLRCCICPLHWQHKDLSNCAAACNTHCHAVCMSSMHTCL